MTPLPRPSVSPLPSICYAPPVTVPFSTMVRDALIALGLVRRPRPSLRIKQLTDAFLRQVEAEDESQSAEESQAP
jgi:hypothetical protein